MLTVVKRAKSSTRTLISLNHMGVILSDSDSNSGGVYTTIYILRTASVCVGIGANIQQGRGSAVRWRLKPTVQTLLLSRCL